MSEEFRRFKRRTPELRVEVYDLMTQEVMGSVVNISEYGVMLLAGALSGATDPLQPRARFTNPGAPGSATGAAGGAHATYFQRIKSVADLDAAIAAANASGKTVTRTRELRDVEP